MTTIQISTLISNAMIALLGGGLFGAWLTHRRLGPKSSAEAREITAAAMDKDWSRFEREIARLVKRLEDAEDKAERAARGQRECEEREIGLKARIAKLEAINDAQGEIRARAQEVVAADRLARKGGV